MYGLKQQDIEIIHQLFRQYPGIEEAILFGSRAMGNFKPGSDVDLALKGDLTEEVVSLVSIALNERLPLPYKFDILGYSFLEKSALKDHIDKLGRSFYCKTPK